VARGEREQVITDERVERGKIVKPNQTCTLFTNYPNSYARGGQRRDNFQRREESDSNGEAQQSSERHELSTQPPRPEKIW